MDEAKQVHNRYENQRAMQPIQRSKAAHTTYDFNPIQLITVNCGANQ
jgi:hypothetical protein